MGAWRWVVARASGFAEVPLAVLLPVAVAGLMFGATCGAPDEVMRGQAQLTGGNTGGVGGGTFSSSSSSGGTTAPAGSTASSTLTGGSVGPGGAGSSGNPGGAGGSSSVGGNSILGGATTAGGNSGSGGISTTGGKGSGGAGTGGKGSGGAATGGKNTGGAATGGVASGGAATGGATASSTGGAGGGVSPFGGTPDAGGAGSGGVTTGGTTTVSGGTGGSSGGASGSGGATSTAPPPTGLAASVLQKATGSPGQMSLSLQISNSASQSVDMSTVTLRYWYQDEALGTAALEVDYASVGDSTDIKAKVQGTVVAASPPASGADHYLEISFTAVTLSPKGTTGNASLLTINGRLHNSGFQGAVDVTNDYSYNSGATGLDDKITLYQSGKLVSGTPPP